MPFVCTGAFLLAEAGLLAGRRVTTHWAFSEALARRYPDVRVDAEPIHVRDGNVVTSAGVTAGIDLALALVEEDISRAAALSVARHLVVYLRRPGGCGPPTRSAAGPPRSAPAPSSWPPRACCKAAGPPRTGWPWTGWPTTGRSPRPSG